MMVNGYGISVSGSPAAIALGAGLRRWSASRAASLSGVLYFLFA